MSLTEPYGVYVYHDTGITEAETYTFPPGDMTANTTTFSETVPNTVGGTYTVSASSKQATNNYFFYEAFTAAVDLGSSWATANGNRGNRPDEWIELKLPRKISVHNIKFTNASSATATNVVGALSGADVYGTDSQTGEKFLLGKIDDIPFNGNKTMYTETKKMCDIISVENLRSVKTTSSYIAIANISITGALQEVSGWHKAVNTYIWKNAWVVAEPHINIDNEWQSVK